MKTRLGYWAAPVGVAVVIAGIVAFSSSAQADPSLPDITAQQLVANVASAQPAAFSGTVAITTDVGLPDLSSLQNLLGTQLGGLTSLLGGTTQVKVAVDPATGARAEINSNTSAWVAVANVANDDGWLYVSDSNSATHLTASGSSAESPGDPATAMTPEALADKLINAASPSTSFEVARTTTVAGHAAYTLVMTPKDAGSLISSVDVMVDATTWMPLGVEIWSTQLADNPAVSVKFTSLSYSTPSASLFNFTAPPGATVDDVDLSQPAPNASDQVTSFPTYQPAATVVAGQGWASIVEVAGLPSDVVAALADPSQLASILGGGQIDSYGPSGRGGDLSQLFGSLAQVTDQGTAYSTYLGSVLVTPDGRIFLGSVPVSSLESAAAATQ
ncbi:MAG: hypothetical protein FWF36_01060 [Propionibacteriaceae bacterium]|nr:hypothetical protein [Propionibacteriaceae bacterium]